MNLKALMVESEKADDLELWSLTDELRDKFGPAVKEYIDLLESGKFWDVNEVYLNLTNQGINPTQLKKLVIELGYEDMGTDINGSSCDYWNYLENPKRYGFARVLCICGIAMNFEVILRSDIEKEERPCERNGDCSADYT